MPKSKRAKVYHLTQVSKKTREQKNELLERIQACVPEYKHCFVLGFDNMRNNHLKTVRHELKDSRLFFGKTKLMSRALGTSSPSESLATNLHLLHPYLTGSVALLFTNQPPADIIAYFSTLSPVDFARAGAIASRDFIIPNGVVYSTGGSVPVENDVPMGHAIEPELRRLGMPVRMVRGKVVLGGGGGQDGDMEVDTAGEKEDGRDEGYVVCREGKVLDSRQTRLLKLFDQCLSEFRVKVLAYWTSETEVVTVVEQPDETKGEDEGSEDEDGNVE